MRKITQKTQNPLCMPGPARKYREQFLTVDELVAYSGLSISTIRKIEDGTLPLNRDYCRALSEIAKNSRKPTIHTTKLIELQLKWIEDYRALPRYPKLTSLPVYHKQDEEYLDKFDKYVTRIKAYRKVGADYSPPVGTFKEFIADVFTTTAFCAKVLKVNNSALNRPREVPLEMRKALVRAGFNMVLPTIDGYFNDGDR